MIAVAVFMSLSLIPMYVKGMRTLVIASPYRNPL